MVLALPFPAIDPIAVAIGPIAIRWYALAYVVGLLGGWFYARRLADDARLWGEVRRPTAADMDDLIVWVALGVVLGGRIGYVLFYNFDIYLAHPAEMLAVWRGGMSFHGGFIGCLLAILVFARRRGLDGLALLDVAAAVVPIGLFFGRIANFVNGELWGRPAPDFPYAVVFPQGGPVPRHPSQLYEAFLEGIVLFAILWWMFWKTNARYEPGKLVGAFIFFYGCFRFGLEFIREPDSQLTEFARATGLHMGQWLSLPMILGGLWLMATAKRRRVRVEPTVGTASVA
jgi:phosphatidylglycerol:prolipoprotein diacylglycerol transferase